MTGQYPRIRRLRAIAALTLLLGGALASAPLVALQRDPIEQETLGDRVRQRGLGAVPLP